MSTLRRMDREYDTVEQVLADIEATPHPSPVPGFVVEINGVVYGGLM